MPFPIAAALPWVASAVGTMLPAIVNSFRSGKSPEEAQAEIAPQRQALIERLVGSGMTGPAAEAMADESLADELAKTQLPEEMNPWLSMALSVGGAIGGWKAGKMLGNKMGAAKAAPIDTPAEQAIAKPASGPSPQDVQSAMAGGMPLTKGKAVVTKGGGDVGQMMGGSPFPMAESAGMPLTLGKAVKPPRRDNVDVGAMLGGGPFPG